MEVRSASSLLSALLRTPSVHYRLCAVVVEVGLLEVDYKRHCSVGFRVYSLELGLRRLIAVSLKQSQ